MSTNEKKEALRLKLVELTGDLNVSNIFRNLGIESQRANFTSFLNGNLNKLSVKNALLILEYLNNKNYYNIQEKKALCVEEYYSYKLLTSDEKFLLRVVHMVDYRIKKNSRKKEFISEFRYPELVKVYKRFCNEVKTLKEFIDYLIECINEHKISKESQLYNCLLKFNILNTEDELNLFVSQLPEEKVKELEFTEQGIGIYIGNDDFRFAISAKTNYDGNVRIALVNESELWYFSLDWTYFNGKNMKIYSNRFSDTPDLELEDASYRIYFYDNTYIISKIDKTSVLVY